VTNAILDVRIFKQNVLRTRRGGAQKGGLAGAPWARDHDRGEAAERGVEQRDDLAADQRHLRIIK
jgi:hypothetical protein